MFKTNNRLQKEFIKRTVLKDLETLQSQDSHYLAASDIKKIEYYYGNAVASILGEGFCILRGKAMTDTERTALTYLGALTGIFDDFFDKLNTPHNHIKNLINSPNTSVATNFHEELFLTFWQKALAELPDPDSTIKIFHRVFDAQILSQKQATGELSTVEIKNITFEKGAASIQFYRTVFGELTDSNEYELVEKIGAIGQLENDIFDVYKDAQNNIQTLATVTNNIEPLRQQYQDLLDEVKSCVRSTKYDAKNTQSFIQFFSAIISRGFVCLNFLEKKESKSAGKFQPKTYERKDLICDMEKPMNMLKNLHYYARSA